MVYIGSVYTISSVVVSSSFVLNGVEPGGTMGNVT